ncbi:MAG TPA: hypothetical protein VHB20_19110 [Verrucomicrobiae bacterium]|jgi:general secretion pathway protein D|nr:hypothetical protein [Verrucomicrobiae bacterium]
MTSKLQRCALRILLTGFCLLVAAPLFGQTRGGGGGGGFGGGGGGFGGGGFGGAGRGASSTSSSSTSSGVTYPPNGTVGSASYYVDEASHKLVVISDADTARYITQVVSNLSIPKPQVLIKVVFVEVTYNNSLDVGLEGGVVKHISGSTTLGASNIFGLLQQGSAATPGITTLPGAGLYTIAGDSFTATLRAIAERGKVEVLSRPSVLARNSQQATIVVGQQVPLITGVTFDNFGNQRNSIAYQNVGIILEVTPFINTDGTVEMIVAPQISGVSPTQSQAIAFGTNGSAITAPYLDIRSANTVVVTPDGQTVVIGGLMQNSKSSTDSKIPVLGDIPLLGALFHHKVSADTKTELLIFLTPYVVKTPMDLARMSVDERSRADLSPKAFTEKDLNRYLDAPPVVPSVGAPDNGSPSATASPHGRH